MGWELLGAEASGITRRRLDVRRMRSSVCASSLVWCATSKSRWTKHRPTLSRQVAVSVPRVGPRPLPCDSHRAQPHSCGVASFGSVLPESLAGSQAKSKGEAEPDELMDLQDTVPRCLVLFAACRIREYSTANPTLPAQVVSRQEDLIESLKDMVCCGLSAHCVPLQQPPCGCLPRLLHCHICAGTGLGPATSAPGLGSALPLLQRDSMSARRRSSGRSEICARGFALPGGGWR